jgi:sucrose-phosphate synthase
MSKRQKKPAGLYIAMVSPHGLIRGHDLELGRDADTGGQTKYVVELCQALARSDGVARVDLFTRLVAAPDISPDYSQPIEDLGNGARIVRIVAGPTEEYIPKEWLWDHLDSFVDNMAGFIRDQGQIPNILHSHYADAGYIASKLANFLEIPMIHTGHSLGRVKRRRLLATGLSSSEIDEKYSMSRRIEAEEMTLASADRVITSTYQEIEEQYQLYDHYQTEQMKVIPPGTDLERFHPANGDEWSSSIGQDIRRFLTEPDKPVILALSRPDPRKNIGALIEAYGGSKRLRELANLVIVAGNRDDITDMDSGAREVLSDILISIDRHDLYGQVAIPKHHQADDVPLIYRIAALSHGVFINPALTEPFGLTLIEAAASGLPIVATDDGGPTDIIANCKNGELIDPLDSEEIEAALYKLLNNRDELRKKAENGLKGVEQFYSWQSHAEEYLETIREILDHTKQVQRPPKLRRRMLYHDRAIFTDLDQNLLSNPEAIPELAAVLSANRKCSTFGIATGRRLDSALKEIRQHGIPEPDVLISSGGTVIHYSPDLTEDKFWSEHIDKNWTPHVIAKLLDELPGLKRQPKTEQSRFKLSYYYNPEIAPSHEDIVSLLHQEEMNVNVTISFGQFLDILPNRASKGLALRYVADRCGIPLDHCLVAGGSGADEDMMRGNTLAVVVNNRHHEELSHLSEIEHVYYAKQSHAHGIIEAIEHFDFFSSCLVPNDEAYQET